MTSATVDRSEFRHILLSGTIVGAVTGAAVVLFLLVSRSGLLPAGVVTSFLLMLIVLADIILLRPFHAFPWTWDAVGGGSTWWYLPIWWMLGTFVAWMGAIVTAGRGARGGDTAIRSLAIPAVLGGLSAGLGLGLAGVLLMPVAAGVGFVLMLVIFALVVLARTG